MLVSELLQERKWIKTDPSKRGMFAGKGAGELEAQYARLKKSGPHKKGSKELKKMHELMFAIRAKKGGGFTKEDQEELDNLNVLLEATFSDDSVEMDEKLKKFCADHNIKCRATGAHGHHTFTGSRKDLEAMIDAHWGEPDDYKTMIEAVSPEEVLEVVSQFVLALVSRDRVKGFFKDDNSDLVKKQDAKKFASRDEAEKKAKWCTDKFKGIHPGERFKVVPA